MKDFLTVRQVLIYLGIFSVTFTLSCRKKTSPEETDVNQTITQDILQVPADGVAATVNEIEIKETKAYFGIAPIEPMSLTFISIAFFPICSGVKYFNEK